MHTTIGPAVRLEAIHYAIRVTEYRLLTAEPGTERQRWLRDRLRRLADRLRDAEQQQPHGIGGAFAG